MLLSIVILALVFILVSQLFLHGSLRALRDEVRRTLLHIREGGEARMVASFEVGDARESRSKCRTRVHFRVRVSYLGREMPATALDLSTTGALLGFESDQPFRSGETMQLAIEFSETETVETRFRVVRILSEREFGGCFEELPIRSKKIIASKINDEARKQLSQDFT